MIIIITDKLLSSLIKILLPFLLLLSPAFSYDYVVLEVYKDDYAINEFAKELANELSKIQGYAPQVTYSYKKGSAIIIGGSYKQIDRFKIVTNTTDGYTITRILGNNKRSYLYGISRLIDALRTGHEIPKNIEVKPLFVYRITGTVGLNNLTQWKEFCKFAIYYGYNGIVINSVDDIITYENTSILSKDIYDIRKRNFERYKKMVEYADSLGLDIYFYNDEFRYTKGEEKFVEDICITNPKFWELERLKYNELFRKFPEVDGVMIRIGEVYPKKYQKSFEIDKYPSFKCSKLNYTQTLNYFVKNLKKIIVDENNKTYIQRTWSILFNNWHTDVNLYKKAIDNLTGVIMSVKYVQGDFFEYLPYNPTIGIGKLPQIVEYQCRREFEGMGLFPNYLGYEFNDSLSYIGSDIPGVWIWPQGGGPPQVENLIFFEGYWKWIDANYYTVSKLLWEPHGNITEIAIDWITWRFGKNKVRYLLPLLLKSHEIIKKGFYMSCFAKPHSIYKLFHLFPYKRFPKSDSLLKKIRQYIDLLPASVDSDGRLQAAFYHIQWCTFKPEGMLLVAPVCIDEIPKDYEEATWALNELNKSYEKVKANIDNETKLTVEHELALLKLMRAYRKASLLFYRFQLTGYPKGLNEALEDLQSSLSEYHSKYSSKCQIIGYATKAEGGAIIKCKGIDGAYNVDELKLFLKIAKLLKIPIIPILLIILYIFATVITIKVRRF